MAVVIKYASPVHNRPNIHTTTFTCVWKDGTNTGKPLSIGDFNILVENNMITRNY